MDTSLVFSALYAGAAVVFLLLIVVEGRAAANEPEHAEGDLPQLESPQVPGRKTEGGR